MADNRFVELKEQYGPVEGYFKYASEQKYGQQPSSPEEAYLLKLQDVMAALVSQGLAEDTAYSILEQVSDYLSTTDPEAIEWDDLPYYRQINSMDFPQYLEEQVKKGEKYQTGLAEEERKAKKAEYEKQLSWDSYRRQLLPYLNAQQLNQNQINTFLSNAKELLDVGVKASDLPFYSESEEYHKQIQSGEYQKAVQEGQNQPQKRWEPLRADTEGYFSYSQIAARSKAEKQRKLAELTDPKDWIKRWEVANTPIEAERYLAEEAIEERQSWLNQAISKAQFETEQEAATINADTGIWNRPTTYLGDVPVNQSRAKLAELEAEKIRLEELRLQAVANRPELVKPQLKTPQWLANITGLKAGSVMKKGAKFATPSAQMWSKLSPTRQAMAGAYFDWNAPNTYGYQDVMWDIQRRLPSTPRGAGNIRWSAVRQ